MMKKFTVKDFITYNGPCFSCRAKVNFKVGVTYINQSIDSVHLVPVVKNDFIEIDLKINYHDGLKLRIFPKTNKIQTSSMRGLTKYLDEHKLYLRTHCDHCYTSVESQFLEFNLLKEFIKPVGISREMVIVNDGNNMYQVHSSFIDESSVVIIDRISKTTPITPIRMELPLLPIYKFKTKERFLEKMKTYLIFS